MRAEPERLAVAIFIYPPLSSKCNASVNCAKDRRSPTLRYGPTGDFSAFTLIDNFGSFYVPRFSTNKAETST
jgi:hypothetical protein